MDICAAAPQRKQQGNLRTGNRCLQAHHRYYFYYLQQTVSNHATFEELACRYREIVSKKKSHLHRTAAMILLRSTYAETMPSADLSGLNRISK